MFAIEDIYIYIYSFWRIQLEKLLSILKSDVAESASHPSVLMWAVGMCTAL